MNAVLEDHEVDTTLAEVSASVLANARRSFVDVDPAHLERKVHEVVSLLWTGSPKVTSFIPVLALRELRDSLQVEREPLET